MLGLVATSAWGQERRVWPDERQVGPFHCHADFSLASRGELLKQLGSLQRDVERQLELRTGREPIHLLLFEHRPTFHAYVARHFPKVPLRPALFIKSSRGPGMVFAHQSKNFDVDLRHESTHALLHTALPMVPLWLDEGLAEYYELPPKARAGGGDKISKVRWGLTWGTNRTIERLENLSRLEDMGATEYRDAWAWVHFMLHGPPQAKAELLNYLQAIASHQPPGKLSRRLRRRLPNLDRAFSRHFRTWR